MLDFNFRNPTNILFGRGKIATINEHISPGSRVLILYGGGSVRANGTLAQATAALAGYTLFEFSGIEPNPSYETLMKAVELVQDESIDFLLAVGGGSVIDGTKFVAAAALFEGEPWSILLDRGASIERALPMGTVLTLPATGSEMNRGAVVTRRALQAKLVFHSSHVFPQFSVLDPEKTYSLPLKQISNGVVDAYVHVMEQYLTYPVNAMVQDRFAEGLLLTLLEVGPRALADPEDYDLRANLMWSATMGLNGLIGAGVPQDWATHMIGHELTAAHGLDHAQTLAIILPSLLTVCQEDKWAKLLQYAERVWGLKGGGEETRIEAAIALTRKFFEQMRIKTHLSDYGIGEESIPRLLQQLETHGMVALGERQSVTLDVSKKILEMSL
ncbi:iron-containing alcohol dehydrogenase [Desulfotalea psychrophila]|nr:iron-containing alcohol dehydrogenase [Desulfotalea psychrophila]